MRERAGINQIKAQSRRHTEIFRGFRNAEIVKEGRSQRDATLATGCYVRSFNTRRRVGVGHALRVAREVFGVDSAKLDKVFDEAR